MAVTSLPTYYVFIFLPSFATGGFSSWYWAVLTMAQVSNVTGLSSWKLTLFVHVDLLYNVPFHFYNVLIHQRMDVLSSVSALMERHAPTMLC